jgi:N-acetylmuramoyl-L-alanine amidase
MKATSIPTHEQSFLTTGIDSNGKKFKLKSNTVAVPGNGETIKIIDCVRENNDDSFYFKEVVPKEKIVLHFTAGYLKGDIGRLTTSGDHVSVPYVIGRGGEIYKLWDDSYWSYHLGSGASGGNTEMSKKSIAIEISNIAWLEKVGQNLVSSYSKTDVYCTLAESAYYTKLVTPYRDQVYFASFTAAQYDSLSKLLKLLLAKYPAIERKFLDVPQRYDYLPDPRAHKCIMSHVNFRQSGKWDIGPAFDWDKVLL